MEENEYYSFERVLRELQIEREELTRLADEGEIRAFREGGLLKFIKSDIDGLKRGRMTEPSIILPQDFGEDEADDDEILLVEEDDEAALLSIEELEKDEEIAVEKADDNANADIYLPEPLLTIEGVQQAEEGEVSSQGVNVSPAEVFFPESQKPSVPESQKPSVPEEHRTPSSQEVLQKSKKVPKVPGLSPAALRKQHLEHILTGYMKSCDRYKDANNAFMLLTTFLGGVSVTALTGSLDIKNAIFAQTLLAFLSLSCFAFFMALLVAIYSNIVLNRFSNVAVLMKTRKDLIWGLKTFYYQGQALKNASQIFSVGGVISITLFIFGWISWRSKSVGGLCLVTIIFAVIWGYRYCKNRSEIFYSRDLLTGPLARKSKDASVKNVKIQESARTETSKGKSEDEDDEFIWDEEPEADEFAHWETNLPLLETLEIENDHDREITPIVIEPEQERFTWEVRKKISPTGVWIVRLAGTIDGKVLQNFKDQLQAAFTSECRQLLLNFSAVNYINRAAVEVLLECCDKFRAKHGNMALVSVPEKLKGFLDLLGVQSVLNIYNSEEEATL